MSQSLLVNGTSGLTIRTAINANFTEIYALLTGLAGGNTWIGGTLTTQGLTIRANAADTTTGTIVLGSSLDASSKTVGAVTMAGGLAIAKKLYAGATTLDSLTVVGDASPNTLSLGTIAAARVITLAAASVIPIQVNVLSSANAAGSVTLGAIYGKAANDTLDQSNVQLVGVLARADMGKNAVDAYAVQAHTTLRDGAASTGNMTAVSGKTILYDNNAAGIVSAGLFTLEGQVSGTHGAVPRVPNAAYGVWIDVVDVTCPAGLEIATTRATMAVGLKFDKSGVGGAITKEIQMQNGETLDNAVDGTIECSAILKATGFNIGAVQVVGGQVAAIALDAETDANKITAIIAALRSHGLLGPNA